MALLFWGLGGSSRRRRGALLLGFAPSSVKKCSFPFTCPFTFTGSSLSVTSSVSDGGGENHHRDGLGLGLGGRTVVSLKGLGGGQGQYRGGVPKGQGQGKAILGTKMIIGMARTISRKSSSSILACRSPSTSTTSPGRGQGYSPSHSHFPSHSHSQKRGVFTAAIERKLGSVEERHRSLEATLTECLRPGKQVCRNELAKLSKEINSLSGLVDATKNLKSLREEASGLKEMIKSEEEDKQRYDPELAALAAEELLSLESRMADLETEVVRMLLPRDEADDRNVILEVRAGTGGLEASLFTLDMFEMYKKFAHQSGWNFQPLTVTTSDLGGYREATACITGQDCFSVLKYESGVHRVQRVPVNDVRIHTSAATVAVLPEAQEVDVELKDCDLRFDYFRCQGPGGQSVNKTESGCRVTHVPTNTVVAMQDERSQHLNRNKALRILRSRVYEEKRRKVMEEHNSVRCAQIGSGDRSERIRTYNFPQDRVTDHRVNLTKHGVTQMLDGNLLADFIHVLKQKDQEESMRTFLEDS